METIYSDDLTEITYLPGTSGTAIVSFAGIGMGLGAVQTEEFRKSLSGTPNDLFFVKDKSRHWYNGSFNRIEETLNLKLSSIKVSKTITLGNSMGGFGAIAFAGRLHACDRAIAFAAQSAVDPTVIPWDRRYDRWFTNVARWSGLDAIKLLSRHVSYFTFFGRQEPIDVRHANRFADVHFPSLSVCILDDCGHDVSLYLKQRGLLAPLLDFLLGTQQPSPAWTDILRTVPHSLADRIAGNTPQDS